MTQDHLPLSGPPWTLLVPTPASLSNKKNLMLPASDHWLPLQLSLDLKPTPYISLYSLAISGLGLLPGPFCPAHPGVARPHPWVSLVSCQCSSQVGQLASVHPGVALLELTVGQPARARPHPAAKLYRRHVRTSLCHPHQYVSDDQPTHEKI